MSNNLNNIQKALENRGELVNVPFLTYEERQAVKLEQTLLYHVKQLACTLKYIIECDGHLTGGNNNAKYKTADKCSAPCDWLYYINKKK